MSVLNLFLISLTIRIVRSIQVRPVNEQARLRAAKDMSVLEQALVVFGQVSNPQSCPVTQEFK